MRSPFIALSLEDFADFEAYLDQLPHAYAKHLAAWMDRMVVATTERNRIREAEFERMQKQLDAALVEFNDPLAECIAEICAAPPAPETLH